MARKRKSESVKLLAVDCETDPFLYGAVIEPFVWGIFDGETYSYLWGADCCARFIEELMHIAQECPDEKIMVYAHNGGKFDYMFLLKYLDPDLTIINGRIARATLFDGVVELRDSFLLAPVPLRALDKDDIDYAKLSADVREIHKNEIVRYLRKDCESLFALVSQFIDRFGIRLTLAGTALAEIKKTGYKVVHTPEHYDTFFRPYYFGGRTQCFKGGAHSGFIEYYDINSAYPFSMLSAHWHGAAYTEKLRLPDSDNGSWFAHIKARSRGALPRRDKGLYFPVDEGVSDYFASGWEINSALDLGVLDIERVERVYVPHARAHFQEYIYKYYDEKRDAKNGGLHINENRIDYWFAKLLMNSGYGKFAQDGRDFKDYCIVPAGEWPENAPDGPRWVWYADTELQSIFCRDAPSMRFFNVMTAASITAHARSLLLREIARADEVFYCDTDSLICRGFKGAVGKELGEWEKVCDIERLYIGGKKLYAYETNDGEKKVVTKGARLSFDEVKRMVIRGDVIDHKRDAPTFSVRFGPRYIDRKIRCTY